MSRKFKITINNETYEVEVEEIQERIMTQVPTTIPVAPPALAPAASVATLAAPAQKATTPPLTQEQGAGQIVAAPLPGVVLNILVNQGEQVIAGQTLLILEAMKMENEIAAPISGTIISLLASKGQNVNTNETLLTIQ